MNFIEEILCLYDKGDRKEIENKLYESEDFKNSLLIEVEQLRKNLKRLKDEMKE